jgi:hypothetical protein
MYGALFAAGTLVAAIASPWPANAVLYAISGGAYTAATIAWALAIDPPSPDPRFKERVAIHVPDVSHGISDAARARLLELSASIAQHGLALSEIEGRILGADQAKDGVAAKQQRGHFGEVVGDIEKMGAEIEQLTKTLRPDPAEKAFHANLARLQQHGLPAEVTDHWSQLHLPPETLSAIVKVAEHKNLAAQVVPPTQAAMRFGEAAAAMARETAKAARKSPYAPRP